MNEATGAEQAIVAHVANAALPAADEWTTIIEMADALFRSGLLPSHIRSTQATLAIMLKGRELGVPAMQALSNIVVVNGKPTCNSELMLALVYRDHGDDALQFVETTAECCTISYKRRGWTARCAYSFTIQDAAMAGLSGLPSWRKYPAAMLRARCISAVARMAFPDSISGMYSYEEMGVAVEVRDGDQVVLASSLDGRQNGTRGAMAAATAGGAKAAVAANGVETVAAADGARLEPAACSSPPGEADDAARKRAVAVQVQQACRECGLPVPGPYRDWNALARQLGVPTLATHAQMTVSWLERLLERLAEWATLMAQVRQLAEKLGHAAPGDLSQLGALADACGLRQPAAWTEVTAGYLTALIGKLENRLCADAGGVAAAGDAGDGPASLRAYYAAKVVQARRLAVIESLKERIQSDAARGLLAPDEAGALLALAAERGKALSAPQRDRAGAAF